MSLPELERVVADYQLEFEQLLNDTFSEGELLKYESLIDAIAAVHVQPVSQELEFEDFYADLTQFENQKAFFERVRSSVCFENLPYLEDNPFQVTYLTDLLWSFDEILIDRGGIHEIVFKKKFLADIMQLKNIDSLIVSNEKKINDIKTEIPVTPIDFMLVDVYRELNRLNGRNLDIHQLSEKARLIYQCATSVKLDSTELFKKSGLSPKDFDDNLERLKFWLKKQ